MYGFIALLHLIAGFGVLVFLGVPQNYNLGGETGIDTVGIGVLAYTFGLRHARRPYRRDRQHHRKLLTDRAEQDRRPLSVGFWFGLEVGE